MRARLHVGVALLIAASSSCRDKMPKRPDIAELSTKPLESQLEIAGKRVQPCVDDWVSEQAALVAADIAPDSPELADALREMGAMTKDDESPPDLGRQLLLVNGAAGARDNVRAVVGCWDESPCTAFARCALKRVAASEDARLKKERADEEARENAAERAAPEPTEIEVGLP